MRLPAIRPITYPEVYISGNVTIDESAIIAPGVILRAASDSSIVIKAGACLGMGSILTASGGNIEIEEGVIIGAGVLVLGSGRIGANACIGSATTIISSSIETHAVVHAGSLIGDPSQDSTITIETPATSLSEEKATDPWSSDASTSVEVEEIPTPTVVTPSEQPKNNAKNPVVGQVYINQLLVTLFPERQSIKNSEHY